MTSINPNVRDVLNRGVLLDKLYRLKDCPVDLCKEYGKFASRYKSILNGKWSGGSKLTDAASEEFREILIFLYESLLKYKTFNNAFFTTSKSLDDFRAMMSLNQVCPYCDITKINKDIVSVDHLLPKGSFPVLSIFPDNLIVVCKACNEVIKGETIYLPIAHPYYEEVSRHFTFVIKENNNNKFTIEIATNSKNSKLINQKIYNFIKLFKIIDRYEKYMTAELQDYRTAVRKSAIAELNGVAQFRSITRNDIENCTRKYFQEAILDNTKLKRAVDGSKIKNDYINQIIKENAYQNDIEYIESHFFGFVTSKYE
ncbi:hypothetical protein [Paenibacillus terrae]|uniref:HNH domain-containing protein n=1 Tax=Paenibacillus terrae TaxID=159743 RepID=A0A0D7X4D7_9BACL|nr:hypothetical protein [Paenibacillus terrae]KJD45828.1 hypothetical protein QD47_09255 [Paenibacillus terrae]